MLSRMTLVRVAGALPILQVLSEGRKKLGFNQEWMPDSDFKRGAWLSDLTRPLDSRHVALKDLQLRGRGSRPSEGRATSKFRWEATDCSSVVFFLAACFAPFVLQTGCKGGASYLVSV